MNNRISPYVFGRVCSGSIKELNDFIFEDYDYLFSCYNKEINKLNKVTSDLIDYLYLKTNQENDNLIKLNLIKIKRDVFNNRDINKYLNVKEVQQDYNLQQKIKNKISYGVEVSKLSNKIKLLYDQKIDQSICSLREKTRESFFSNGLLFSSSSLLKDHEKWLLGMNSNLNKKEKKICLSLLRYYLRSTTKTSPFSSFNQVFLYKKDDTILNPVQVGKQNSRITISNIIFYLFKILFINDPELRMSVEVYVNPTLIKNNLYYQFFKNDDNHEGFYKIEQNDFVNYIVDFLKKKENDLSNYELLINSLKKVVDSTTPEIVNYLDNLVAKKLLLFNFGIHIKDCNWPEKLLEKFQELLKQIPENKTLKTLILLLDQIISSARQLENKLNYQTRRNIIFSLSSLIKNELYELDILSKTDKTKNILDKLTPSDLFYEDTLTQKVESINIKSIEPSINHISNLSATLNLIAYKTELRNEIIKIFREACFEGEKVSLLHFYEKNYLKRIKQFSILISSCYDSYRNEFKDFYNVLNSVKKKDKIDLHKYITLKTSNNPNSLDVFTQYGKVEGTDTIVINSLSNCFITKTSRFINHFQSKEILDEVKKQYNHVYKNREVCELIDASIHNTNTIPNFTKKCIDVSLTPNNNQNYNLNELFISINTLNQPIILNKDDKQIIPIDFSMEGINRKSPLMRFIDIFSDANNEGISFFLRLYENHIISLTPKDQDFIFIPRLYYTDKIVLYRKKWIIKKQFLNELFSNIHSEYMHFLLFNQWRNEHKVPDHIFIKELRKNNLSKPQYINLKAPLLFRLFKKIIADASDRIEITEMLPEPEVLNLEKNGNEKISELVLGIYNSDSKQKQA